MDIEKELAKQIGHLTLEIYKREAIVVAQRNVIADRDETIRTLRIELDAAKAPKPQPRVLTDEDRAAVKDMAARVRDRRDEEHINGGPH